MPISVTCAECNSTYRVGDEAAGKAIKCKKCGARIAVPGTADDDLSARNAGGGGDGEAEGGGAKAKKKGSGKLIAIIVGAVLGACCICTGVGGLTTWWIVGKAKEGAKDFADQFNKGFDEAMKKAQKDKGVAAGGPAILDKRETLTAKDPAVANGKPAKVYKIRLEAEKLYVIDMKAEKQGFGYDPYLILLDPKNQQVAKDDDSGGGLDAQIVYRPPSAGEYTIQATVLNAVAPDGLPFHLTVKLK